MQRRSIIVFLATTALIGLLASMPLTHAEAQGNQHTIAAQLVTHGSILDQFDSMLNNLTKQLDINSLTPTNQEASPTAKTPSVKIADVKASSSGLSNAQQQVTVTLKNGNAAASGVRVSVYYSTTGGSAASSNSTVVSLNAGETRAIQFSPSGLAPGSYAVSVVAFKDGTDPSNKATPPYDLRENAVTLSVTPAPTAASTEKATEVQDNPNAFGDVISQVNTWILFIIVISALITIALFLVFSQNKSGEDRFEEDHFSDEYPPGDAEQGKTPSTLPPPQSSIGSAPGEMPDTEARPRRRQIAIDAAEPDEHAQATSYDAARPPPVERGFNSDGFVVGDVSSKKALRNKIWGKKGA